MVTPFSFGSMIGTVLLFFVVRPEPNFQLVHRGCKRLKAVLVHIFCSEPATKCFAKGNISRLAGAREVQNNTALLDPATNVEQSNPMASQAVCNDTARTLHIP